MNRPKIVGFCPFAIGRPTCACPVCKGEPLHRGHYCTYCDRCGLDDLIAVGKLELWGLEPDTSLNPGWERTTKYRRAGRLAGGVGRSKAKAG